MLFRAIFWIGLVSLLMPHEPDLGFGRPGAPAAGAAAPSLDALIASGGDTRAACIAAACGRGLSVLDGFHSVAMRSMDEVRADLEAHRTRFR
ncbi:MAG TPA: hypothetical protein VMU08_03050 [Rhizomicrobium sp.]|nr:hypothetical protein [Rhizomicrobium sp.]